MKFKKIISAMVGSAVVCSSLPIGTVVNFAEDNAIVANAAETGQCGDNATYTLDDNGVLTISGTGKMKDYYTAQVLPFYKNDLIKSIVIEDGITSIGYNFFNGCTNLTSIKIPESVTKIFFYCFFRLYKS